MAKKQIKLPWSLKRIFVVLLCILSLLTGLVLGSQSNNSPKPLDNKFISAMPDGWQVKVEDNTNCHTVTVDAERITSETLEQYLETKYNEPLESLVDSQNTYDINDKDVYVLKPQDDDGKNLIYLKSSNGTIYMIRIYDKPSDSRPTGAFCNKINPFVNLLITSLK